MGITPEFWRDRRVFVTGHTGFKGAWLVRWLHRLEAAVYGYALAPPTTPSLFEASSVKELLARDHRADILDQQRLAEALNDAQPEVLFHLAAQSLVRESYRQPLETFATNILGTANVLEAARALSSLKAIVVITTDKCYENREWVHPYRENDPLGGADPYSASKAAAELVAGAYRCSFLGKRETACHLATARAGNVFGGGDWAAERLIPDCIRAFQRGEKVMLRYPRATRPWQHVLEPLAGYLMLAEQLAGDAGADYATSWNFGPEAQDEASVEFVAKAIARAWGAGADIESAGDAPVYHEAGLLRLDSTKARVKLGWRPHWQLPEALVATAAWYKDAAQGKDLAQLTDQQIDSYSNLVAALGGTT